MISFEKNTKCEKESIAAVRRKVAKLKCIYLAEDRAAILKQDAEHIY